MGFEIRSVLPFFTLGLFGSRMGARGSRQCLLTILTFGSADSDSGFLGTAAIGGITVGEVSLFSTASLSDLASGGSAWARVTAMAAIPCVMEGIVSCCLEIA